MIILRDRLSIEMKIFIVAFIKIWNKLSSFLRPCPNSAQFKAALAQLLDILLPIN